MKFYILFLLLVNFEFPVLKKGVLKRENNALKPQIFKRVFQNTFICIFIFPKKSKKFFIFFRNV
jgi:hypothetical protein